MSELSAAQSVHAEHFGTDEARERAAHLGMWIFLSTEVLLFAALFAGYAVYRMSYPAVFEAAREHMAVALGTINTYLLVSASVLVAFAVWAVRNGRRALGVFLLVLAGCLGAAFLGIKAVEYAKHIREGALPGAWYHFEKLKVPGASLYFTLYYLLTGLHALHVAIGTGVLLTLAARVLGGTVRASYPTPLELGGMYWHLVDIIWLFLWPLLYLA